MPALTLLVLRCHDLPRSRSFYDALTVASPDSTLRRLAELGFTVDPARSLATDPDARHVEIHGSRGVT